MVALVTECSLVDSSLSVVKVSAGDAWIALTVGTGSAHAAALGRVYGHLHPVVLRCGGNRRKPTAVIAFLYVPKAMRGRGLGARLVTAALNDAGNPHTYACMTPDRESLYPKLWRFYQRLGFSRCSPTPWIERAAMRAGTP